MKTKLEPQDIVDAIRFVQYHQFEGTTVTICCLTLQNGFNVIGQSACIDPNMFDEEKGKSLAYEDAKNKIWQLEGYRLKQAMQDDAEWKEMVNKLAF